MDLYSLELIFYGTKRILEDSAISFRVSLCYKIRKEDTLNGINVHRELRRPTLTRIR